jgi:hypothetical protein
MLIPIIVTTLGLLGSPAASGAQLQPLCRASRRGTPWVPTALAGRKKHTQTRGKPGRGKVGITPNDREAAKRMAGLEAKAPYHLQMAIYHVARGDSWETANAKVAAITRANAAAAAAGMSSQGDRQLPSFHVTRGGSWTKARARVAASTRADMAKKERAAAITRANVAEAAARKDPPSQQPRTLPKARGGSEKKAKATLASSMRANMAKKEKAAAVTRANAAAAAARKDGWTFIRRLTDIRRAFTRFAAVGGRKPK